MMITWVRVVGALLMTDCLVADNPCDVVGRTHFLHINGQCVYISPAEDKMDFGGAKRACPTIMRRGRMVVPHSLNTRRYLFSIAKEHEYRWVGMQPIHNELYSVKWVDNSSAQGVFVGSGRFGIAKATQEEPLCMAFGNEDSLIMNCKESIGYICESELHVPLSAADAPPTTPKLSFGENWPLPSTSRINKGATLPSGRDTSKEPRVRLSATNVPPTKPRRPSEEHWSSSFGSPMNSGATSSTGREISKTQGIPMWLVIAISAVAVVLMVGITVLICMCWRRKSRRGSTEDKCKQLSPIATNSESTHHESPETQNPMLDAEEHTYKGHLYEIPRLRGPTRPDNTQRSLYSHSHLTQTQGHGGQTKSALTGDVYAEVNLEEKHKARIDASGAQDDNSDDDYSTSLVENTIYGQ